MDNKQNSDQAVLRPEFGFGMLGNRTQIELTGSDRIRFLNGLCTNDINRLEPGSGCEAFLTNVQGKVIGYVYVFCRSDSLILDTVGEQSDAIVSGLDKYLIREDVELIDRSDEWAEVLVFGFKTRQLLSDLLGMPPAVDMLGHVACDWQNHAVSVRTVPYGGSASFFLSFPRASLDVMREGLGSVGLPPCNELTIEALRIESGTPLFGVDVSSDNLPQEVDRNEHAISFQKGCYLGQETIARLDALGHVNRLLVGVRFTGQSVPPPGAIIKKDDKAVARVTSSCWSTSFQAPLALAYVRREHMTVGSRFETDFGVAEVVRLGSEGVRK